MKNIKILFSGLLTFALIAFLSTSCEFPAKWDIADNGTTAAQLYAPRSLDYYYQVTTAITYDVETFENSGSTVSSITATKQLFSGGEASALATYDITSSQSFSQTTNELLADVPIDGVVLTEDDLLPGDTWVISYQMNLADGRELPIQDARNTTITFTCQSQIEEGEWTASQTNVDWFGVATTKTVTITEESAGVFLISDVSAGGYEACCSSIGYNADQPGVITDVCSKITVTGDGGAQISTAQGLAIGSYDPTTKTLIVHYSDEFNGSAADGFDLFSTFVKD